MSTVAVIGGGPAGAATALLLARRSHHVSLLERDAAPSDRVCGAFLSGETCAMLARLGIDLAGLGARPIMCVRLFARGRSAEAALPFPAMSLSRSRLDAALLDAAAAAGVALVRGVRVDGAEHDSSGWTVRSGGRRWRADRLVLATGKHDLRGHARPHKGPRNGLVGRKWRLRLTAAQSAALAGATELHALPGGYAGLQLVEDAEANLCLLTPAAGALTLEALGSAAPALGRRLAGAAPLADRPLAIAAIPYGFVAADSADGLYRVGDQAAVIDSFTGDGMAIALATGFAMAAAIDRGEEAGCAQAALGRKLAPPVARARWLSRLAATPPGQTAAVSLGRRFPALIRAAAHATRLVPELQLGTCAMQQ